jgi:hypothetical protein
MDDHSGLTLSSDLKSANKTIIDLRSKLDEMLIYKRGYEKGVKQIKKDVLVLRFVNKTKTKLLRKYAEKLEGANKFIDVADLRPQLKHYLEQGFGKRGELPNDGMYIKTQLKTLADQPILINTGDLNEFYLKILCGREKERLQDIRLKEDYIKKLQFKQTNLIGTLEKHRRNITTLPGLLNAIIEDFMVQNDNEKSQEMSLNRRLSRPASTNRGPDLFLTGANVETELAEEKYFINDFTTELYGRLDDEQRKELIFRLMSNKLILFGFREFLLRKLDPVDILNPEYSRMNRLRAVATQSISREPSKRSRMSEEHDKSFSKDGSVGEGRNQRKYLLHKVPSANSKPASSRLTQTFGPIGVQHSKSSLDNKSGPGRNQLPRLEQLNRSDITLQAAITPQPGTIGQAVLARKYSQVRRTDEPTQLSMDVLGKQKLMQFLLHKPGQVGG